MDLIIFFKALWKKSWILIAVPLLAVAIVMVATIGEERLYVSESQLATGFTVNDQLQLENDKFNLRDAEVKFNNLIATLYSPIVVSMVSYRLLLHDLESTKPYRSPNTENFEEVSFDNVNLLRARLILQQKLDSVKLLNTYNPEERKVLKLLEEYNYDHPSIADGLKIFRIGFTDYVQIGYSSEDPYLSAQVVNMLCGEFFRYTNSFRSKQSVESIESLEILLKRKKAELVEKSNTLQKYKSSQGVVNVEAESTSRIEQISAVEENKIEEEKNINSLELKLREVNRRLADLGQGGVGSSRNLNEEYVALGRKLEELQKEYINGGSKDEPLKNEIERLKQNRIDVMSQIQSNEGVDSSVETRQRLIEEKQNLEVDLSIARKNLQTINNNLYRLQGKAGNFASKEAIIQNLQREEEIAQQEYQSALEKYNTIQNISISGGNSIRQVLIGQPSSEPEPSKRMVMAGLAGSGSLVLCILIIALLEYVDTSIRTPSNFERVVKVKMLGSLNLVNLKKHTLKDIFSKSVDKKDADIFGELVRKLRFEILNSGGRVFLFTSTKPGEGKSTVMEALAETFSIAKKSVLLVDTNFQNNTLTRNFDAKQKLEAVLGEGYQPQQVMAGISTTNTPRVEVMGCKGGKYSPTELFSEENFSRFLDEMKNHYDMIFLEGAAINQSTDTKELSKFADKVVAVFAAESVIKQNDKESIDFLRSLDKKLGGGIINKVEIDNLEQ